MSEERLRLLLADVPEGRDLLIVCHGISSNGEPVKFCDGKVDEVRGALSLKIKINFYTHTREGCVEGDDSDFCEMYCDRRCDPLDGDGIIDEGSELLGPASDLGGLADDGFSALALLDTNRDGSIDANDPHFWRLGLWRDADSDGVTDPGELSALALFENGWPSLQF